MNRDQFDKLITELYDQFTQRATNTSTDIDRTVPNRVDHRLLTFKTAHAFPLVSAHYQMLELRFTERSYSL